MPIQTLTEHDGRSVTAVPTAQSRSSEYLVADVSSYVEAREIIDRLTALRLPPKELSIVAKDVRLVEDLRDSPGWTLRLGATLGAVVGTVVGVLFASFTLIDPLVSGLVLAATGWSWVLPSGPCWVRACTRCRPVDGGRLPAWRQRGTRWCARASVWPRRGSSWTRSLPSRRSLAEELVARRRPHQAARTGVSTSP